MLRPATALALLVLGTAALAQSRGAADEAFDNLASEFLSELVNFSPVAATELGDHRADHRLDRVDAAARERTAGQYREYLDALATIDRAALSRDNQVDAALLAHELEYRLWTLTELEEWAWNPLLYVNMAGNALYALLARDFAPLEERLANAAARLEQFERFFDEARSSLVPARVPKVHAETAAAQTRGLATIIDEMLVPHLETLPEDQRLRLASAIEAARTAIANQQSWFEEELLPGAAGDFRVGAGIYDRKLAFALDSTLGRREIVARAEQAYEAVRGEMYEIAREVYARQHPYTTFPDQPDEAYRQAIIRAALEEAYEKLLPPDGIVEAAREALDYATGFVREHEIVTMPDEPLEIIVMPEFQRGVSVAYLDPPGPLDRQTRAFYAVAPLPGDWTEQQVLSFLREYNWYSLHNLTMHEAMPGHYLQVALSNRHPSVLRRLLWSGPFVEGWAVYGERVMIDAGYLDGDPLMRLINLKLYLRVITNAIIDSAIHVDGMTREQAMKLMIEGAFQEEREAAGKWTRAQLTFAQLSTYFVGYQEHAALRRDVEAAWNDEFTLKRYHDALLSYGSPPVRFVRALILDEPIPAD